MLHLYSFLNLSSLNLIPQWPLIWCGPWGWAGNQATSSLLCRWISELIDCCSRLSNCFVKDCFQTLSAWEQDIGFHVLDLLYFLTLVTLKYIYYHKSLCLNSITSTTWKLEISKPRIRHRKEKEWRWWTQKCLDFEIFFKKIFYCSWEKVTKLQKSEAWAYLLCGFALFP